MRMLFVSWHVTGLDRSLGFCTAVGHAELGRTEAGDGAWRGCFVRIIRWLVWCVVD
ncbi:hypothetical protein [Streptomyces sp. NPDC056132]|uniref:hypothetical protein n=1 Tax=Streptomyces sp. NPDC056132 TaxID=3345722 RepID=UPI0035D6CFC6